MKEDQKSKENTSKSTSNNMKKKFRKICLLIIVMASIAFGHLFLFLLAITYQ